MGAFSQLVNGAVDVTTAVADATAAKFYAIIAAVGLVLILLFLLVLFVVEPISATILAVVLVGAAAYIVTKRGDGIR